MLSYQVEKISDKDLTIAITLIIILIYGLYNYFKNNYKIVRLKQRTNNNNYEQYKEKIQEIFGEERTKDEWKKDLLNMVLNNHGVANRLIEAERSIRPKLPEKDLIRLAVERLRRHQR